MIWVPAIGETVDYLYGKLGVPDVGRGKIEAIRSDGSGKPFSIRYLVNGAWRRSIQPPGHFGPIREERTP